MALLPPGGQGGLSPEPALALERPLEAALPLEVFFALALELVLWIPEENMLSP